MYTPSDSFGKVNLMLDLVSQKQRALSSNLANVDTPGYVRKDVNFSQYLGSMNSPLETQLSAKLGPSAIIQDKENAAISPGNELAQMQKNSILYTVATKRLTSLITEMRKVISVGSS